MPGENADGTWVGPHREIAEAGFPIRELESVHRVHLDVDGEQIIAAVRAVLGDALQIELAGEAFADEATEDIRERDDDGIDFAFFDACFRVRSRSCF